jgi:hypothetical protein
LSLVPEEKCGEISIHRAWKWSTESPERRTQVLKTYRREKGAKSTYTGSHFTARAKKRAHAPDLGSLVGHLFMLKPKDEENILND